MDNIEKKQKNIAQLKILYIDDNDSFRMLAKRLFEEYGANLDLVENGVKAIELFTDTEYDLVFVDNLMPEMDGFTTVKEIRRIEAETERAKQTVIIMVSANDEAEHIEDSFDIGCDGYLIKPIKKGDLKDILDYLTGEDGDSDTSCEENKTDTEHDDYEPLEKIIIKVDKDIECIVPEYIENIKKGCLNIPGAISRADFNFIYKFGHNMKGTGSSYGFEYISEIGKVIEKAGNTRDINVINEEVDKLVDYLERIEIVYE